MYFNFSIKKLPILWHFINKHQYIECFYEFIQTTCHLPKNVQCIVEVSVILNNFATQNISYLGHCSWDLLTGYFKSSVNCNRIIKQNSTRQKYLE